MQFPLALPSIMQGINQTTMMALSMVVIASMIGARGIGETVLIGLQRNDPGTGLVGGLAHRASRRHLRPHQPGVRAAGSRRTASAQD